MAKGLLMRAVAIFLCFGAAMWVALLNGCAPADTSKNLNQESADSSLRLATTEHGPEWTLVISNATSGELWLDLESPLTTGFAWVLSKNSRIIKRGKSNDAEADYGMALHTGGPVVVVPRQTLSLSLTSFFKRSCRQLIESTFLGEGDRLHWFCYTWDFCSNRWVSWQGTLTINDGKN